MAARTSGAWVAFGVQMCTTSTSSAASSSSTVPVGNSAPIRSAAARDDSGVEPTIRETTPPARRTARACTVPMKPTPMMPARTRSAIVDSSGCAGVAGAPHGGLLGRSGTGWFGYLMPPAKPWMNFFWANR